MGAGQTGKSLRWKPTGAGSFGKIIIKLKSPLIFLSSSVIRHGASQNPKGAHLKVFIAATALCLAPFTAVAADLGLRKSYLPGADTPATSASPWTGAYAGVNAGGGFGRVTDPDAGSDSEVIKTSGALGGLQVGYNHQVGNYVVGLEADYAMAKVKGHLFQSVTGVPVAGFGVSGNNTIESRLDAFGTIRMRAGIAMNSALLFATGGYAYGRNKLTDSVSVTVTSAMGSGSGAAFYSNSQWMSGWTLGGGVEYAFTPNISGKLEYLYADLGKATFFKGTLMETKVATKLNILRAGVNYRF